MMRMRTEWSGGRRGRSLGSAGSVGRIALAALLAACSTSDEPSAGPQAAATNSPPQSPAPGNGVDVGTGARGDGATGVAGAPQAAPNASVANPDPSASGAPDLVGTSGTPNASGAAGAPQAAPNTEPTPMPVGMPAGTDGPAAPDSGDPAVTMADAGAPEPEPPAQTGTCLQGSGDFLDDGPYGVESQVVTIGSKGQFTIFYPDPLEDDCPHPIVAWGNGTLITGGTAYDHFHKHAASWGIVTISSHNSNVGDGSFHTAAIDYLLEQNEDSSSEFFGKLSPRAGVSGHSQGGAGSDRAAAMHANVEAINNVQGSFGTPPDSDAALLCLTGTADIQPTGCPRAVRAASVPALSASWDGADHVSTTLLEGDGIEQYLRLNAAWFRCFLADDAEACALFMGGADCPVCQERGWDEIFANNY